MGKIEKIIRESIQSVLEGKDVDMTPFEEYENDYPNDSFSKYDITTSDLIKYIKGKSDFLYFFNGRFHSASIDASEEFIEDIYKCNAELSSDLDLKLDLNWDKLFGIDVYVAVFKCFDRYGKKYYIVYESDKF